MIGLLIRAAITIALWMAMRLLVNAVHQMIRDTFFRGPNPDSAVTSAISGLPGYTPRTAPANRTPAPTAGDPLMDLVDSFVDPILGKKPTTPTPATPATWAPAAEPVHTDGKWRWSWDHRDSYMETSMPDTPAIQALRKAITRAIRNDMPECDPTYIDAVTTPENLRDIPPNPDAWCYPVSQCYADTLATTCGLPKYVTRHMMAYNLGCLGKKDRTQKFLSMMLTASRVWPEVQHSVTAEEFTRAIWLLDSKKKPLTDITRYIQAARQSFPNDVANALESAAWDDSRWLPIAMRAAK